MRITDVCTRLEDAVCVAALYVSILRMLYRLRRANQTWRTYPLFLLAENRWRAQRYGVAARCSISARASWCRSPSSSRSCWRWCAEDADALGCGTKSQHARTIVADGTSADRQVAHFNRLLAEGVAQEEALKGVVDYLIKETLG